MSHFLKPFLSLLVLLVAQSSAGSQSIRLEAYGDSLTAGFVSQTNVTNVPSIKPISVMLSKMMMFHLSNDLKYVAPYSRKDLSWFHHVATEVAKNYEIAGFLNFAVPKHHSYHLPGQVSRAGATKDRTIAFFFVGHNDLLQNYNEPSDIAKEFMANISAAAKKWDSLHEGSTLYLLPVGSIHQVFKILSGYVWYETDQGQYQCEDSWQKLFVYARWYHELYKQGRLESVLEPRIAAMNQSLRSYPHQWESKRQNEVVYVPQMENITYLPEYFAVDCFHLSAKGQHEMGELLLRELKF